VEANLVSEDVISPEDVSGPPNGEKSYSTGESLDVGLQLDAHF
jgi:hypothetical protein